MGRLLGMRTARTGSMQRAIQRAVFPYKPGCIVPGQPLGFQGHYNGLRVQKTEVVPVPVNYRPELKVSWRISKDRGHIKALDQGLTGLFFILF